MSLIGVFSTFANYKTMKNPNSHFGMKKKVFSATHSLLTPKQLYKV